MDLRNILFLDIETVASQKDYASLSDRMKALWEKKAVFLKNDDNLAPEALFPERAGIYAEFGKIVTIAVGFFIRRGKLFL